MTEIKETLSAQVKYCQNETRRFRIHQTRALDILREPAIKQISPNALELAQRDADGSG